MPDYNILQGEKYSLGIDCAGRPMGPAVQASPYSLVCRYLSDGGSSLPGKLLMPDEAKSYLDSDVALVSNWETWATRMNEGAQAGRDDAAAAWARHKACGGPDDVAIYFSCDYDASESDQPAINDYLRAAIDYLGIGSVGIYGGYWVCLRAQQAFPGIKIWQTLAWSGGNILPDANLYQRAFGVKVNGVDCDVNEIRTPGAVGAWQDAPTAAPAPVVTQGDSDMGWSEPIKNYAGQPVPAGVMFSWVDKREARNEALLAAILDKLAGSGAAQAVLDKFDADADAYAKAHPA